MVNIDCSDLVSGHSDYKRNLDKLLEKALVRLATNRFGPQTGPRLAEVLADADDLFRFEQVSDLILDSGDGDELLRRLDAKPR